MDISETLAPKSDQLNAVDLLTGPRTVTVERVVVRKNDEQPVAIHLVEFPGRPFKPCATVRRQIASAWGPQSETYTGRRLTLFNDPTVTWGGKAIGGIRVSHASHIDKPDRVTLMIRRGVFETVVTEPLAGPPVIDADTVAGFEQRIGEAQTLEALRAVAGDLKEWDLGQHRDALMAAYNRRGNEIQGGAE